MNAAERAWHDYRLSAEQERKARGVSEDSPAEAVRPSNVGSERRLPHLTVAEAKFLSKDELERLWSAAIQGAARARFPRQGVALREAAYLAAKLVLAERLPEERARAHIERAAARAGVRPAEAERAIRDSWLMGDAHGLEELARGCPRGDDPGAFSAVAAGATTYDLDRGLFVDPEALLPLPVAVLVHRGHDATRQPVGIGVPRVVGGTIRVDAVMASSAGESWTLVRTGRLRSVSTSAQALEWHTGIEGRLVRGVLTAVDLVRTPADETAEIGQVVPAGKLTPGQRRTQRLLDEYLADDRNPLGVDLALAAQRHGASALDVLAPIVAPLRAEHGRSAVVAGAG